MAALLLVVTGRMHWLGAVFAGMLAFLKQGAGILFRYFPMLTQLYRAHSPSSKAPNSSTVRTPIIEMTLYHDTGKLSGKVLAGDYKGKTLDELDEGQLETLRIYCNSKDMDSVRLLESYLVSRFGDTQDYRSSGQGRSATSMSSEMSINEALQVLGLSGMPDKEEITRAYRKIMQQLHPDRGGNEYFAAKANQAREVLLQRVS